MEVQDVQRERAQQMSRLEEVRGIGIATLRYDDPEQNKIIACLNACGNAMRIIFVGMLGNAPADDGSYRCLGVYLQDGSFRVVQVWPNGAWVLDTAKYRVLLARDEGQPVTSFEICRAIDNGPEEAA